MESPKHEQPTTPEQKYSEEELLRWKEGARKFAPLMPILEKELLRSRVEDAAGLVINKLNIFSRRAETSFFQEQVGILQALFLGERAAAWLNGDLSKRLREKLIEAGFSIENHLVYSPEAVRAYIDHEPDLEAYRDRPDEFIRALITRFENGHYLGAFHERLGHLLGFPDSAVDLFVRENIFIHDVIRPLRDIMVMQSREEWDRIAQGVLNVAEPEDIDRDAVELLKTKVKQLSRYLNLDEQGLEEALVLIEKISAKQRVEVYGVVWAGSGEKDEEETKERLKDAFELSGILKTRRSKF